MKGRTTVFPHRGLSPHQFTPMSGAHQITSLDAAMTILLHIADHWRGASEFIR
jgi:hypothetical protein